MQSTKNLDLNLVRPNVLALRSYTAGASYESLHEVRPPNAPEIIKVDTGENLFGPSPKVRTALTSYDWFNYYPDMSYRRLRETLAGYAKVSPAEIVLGNGSDELIDQLYKIFVNQGDEVIDTPPTFGLYHLAAELAGAVLVNVPRRTLDFQLDVEAILAAITPKTKIIWTCSPNNPTGTLTPLSEIARLADTGRIIVVDEAYYEFSPAQSAHSLLNIYPNIVVLRTLSKWAGLAGFRVGYALACPEIIAQFNKVRAPYNLNSAGVVAALASFEDLTYLQGLISLTIAERERMCQVIAELEGCQVYPSGANYIFIKLANISPEKIGAYFAAQQIFVRIFPHLQAFRISIGRPEQNERVLITLSQALKVS